MELWLDIDFNNNYQVSTLGNIRNKKTGTIRKQYEGIYKTIGLYDDKKRKTYNVHRIVAVAFCLNIDDYLYVDHIDGDRYNNNCDNLRWVSSLDNAKNHCIAKNNKSGYNGIYIISNNRYKVDTRINGKTIQTYFYDINDAISFRKQFDDANNYTIR